MTKEGRNLLKRVIGFRALLAFAFFVVAAWQTLVAGGSWWLANSGMTQAALSFDPSSSVANETAALTALTARDFEAAHTYAQNALRAAPVNQEALTIFALSGKRSLIPSLMALSGGLGWRDLQTQLYLVQQAIQNGDADVFAQRFDAYQRQAPANASILSLLDRYVSDGNVRDAIVRRLAAQPDWRSDYLQHVDTFDARVIAGRELLLTALSRAGSPAALTEIQPYVAQLANQGSAIDAHRIWMRFIAHRDAWSGLVYDGGFKYLGGSDSPSPYEWNLPNISGASATAETVSQGHVLHIQSDGTSNGPLATELLWLAPGDYRLLVHASVGENVIQREENYPFEWSVLCDDVRQLLSSPDGEGAPAVAGVRTYSFRVASDCPSPMLSINSTSGNENTAHGLWITNVRIDRIT